MKTFFVHALVSFDRFGYFNSTTKHPKYNLRVILFDNSVLDIRANDHIFNEILQFIVLNMKLLMQ